MYMFSRSTVSIEAASSKAIASKAIASKAIASKAIASKAIASKAIASKAIASKAIASKAISFKGDAVGTIAFAAIALLLFAATPATAQGLNQSVVGTSIAEGQVSVPQTDSITFTLNRKLGFNSLFTRKFHWEPFGKSNRLNVFLDADRKNPRFDIFHAAQQDFSVYVFGVFDEDSMNVMPRPFALNYSTNSTIGNRVVSGSATLDERQPPAGPSTRVVEFLNQTTNNHAVSRFPDSEPIEIESVRTDTRLAKSGSITSLHQTNVDWTVVFLVESFDIDDRDRVVVAAAAVKADGTYAFSHVRDGTYYPLAVTFADIFGNAIGAYGYYDPNGDFAPDPVVVSGGNVGDIALRIYPYSTNVGLTFRDLAEGIVLNVRSDAALVSTSTSDADSSGYSVVWTFRFYSPGSDEEIIVAIDPLTVTTNVIAGGISETTTFLPASGLVDSDTAVELAELNGGADFRAANSSLPVTIEVTGGNLLAKHPANPTRLLWQVRYNVVGGVDPPFIVLVDMRNGVIVGVDDEPVFASELQLSAFPNPWSDKLSIRYETNQTGSLQVDVFDVLGRMVHSGSQQHSGGTGTYVWADDSAAPGVYVVRITDGRNVRSQSVVKVR